MKTIVSLQGADFLRAVNAARKTVIAPLEKLNILQIMRTPVEFTGSETKEQKDEMIKSQTKKNFDTLLDRMLEEYPEETMKLVDCLVVKEEGEEADGLDYMIAALDLLTSQKVIDFLLKLMNSGLLNTAN